MSLDAHEEPAAIQTHIGAIFISLELSRSKWLVTSLAPGGGQRMSRHWVEACDVAGLLARLWAIRDKALARTGIRYPIIVIQEAGLDGFWIHRVLEQEGIESHVVDAASIAVSRRRRRAKTDRIDGEALLRVLMAFKRGEPRVCSMARSPTPEAEDRRRICRERKTLLVERIQHVNRIKGLLFSQGIGDYEPLRRDRREALEAVRTGDGRPLGANMKAQIGRELDRLELLLGQIAAVEAERDAMLAREAKAAQAEAAQEAKRTPAAVEMLMDVKGLGSDTVAMLWTEALYRSFDNRRQVAAFVGLAGTPWQSGSIDHEQGVSKGGNQRLRTAMIQLAWLWPRHQPGSALARWFVERTKGASKLQKKKMAVALARKLLVALWRYVDAGVVIEGAVLKSAAKAS
jgi:transposase